MRFISELQQISKRLDDSKPGRTAPFPPQATQSPESSPPIPRPAPPSPSSEPSQDAPGRSASTVTDAIDMAAEAETKSVHEISFHEESIATESEFDFSESFNFPDNSPRISLN